MNPKNKRTLFLTSTICIILSISCQSASICRYKEPHKNDHFVYAYSSDPNGIACIPDLLLENHLFYCVVVGGSSDGTCYSYGSDLREP